MSRASTQVPLTGLFLAATHGPKTRLTSQGEHALIRPWTLASDVGSYSWSFLRFKVDLSSWESLYLIELDHMNFNVGLYGFSLSCLVSRGARAATWSSDGGGYLSCLMCEVLWVFLKGFLNLKIKLWLMFRSRHLVLWLLGTYGLQESG